MADFKLTYHGTIARLTPLTEAASDWIDEHVETEGWQWLGQSLCIEPRYAPHLVEGMIEDGLTMEEE